MKSITRLSLLSLSLILSFQSVSLAHKTEARNETMRERAENMNVKKMSLKQLEQGLKEVRTNLAILKEDLEVAEAVADDRLAVKVRNGIGLTSVGLIVLGFVYDLHFCKNDCGGGILSGIIFGGMGLAATALTQGYVYLTNSELHDLQNTIKEMEKKMARLSQKIEYRRATQGQ